MNDYWILIGYYYTANPVPNIITMILESNYDVAVILFLANNMPSSFTVFL